MLTVVPQEAPQTDPVIESDMPTSGTVPQDEERSSNGEDSSDRAYTDTENDMNDFEFPAYYKKKLETLGRRRKKLESLGLV